MDQLPERRANNKVTMVEQVSSLVVGLCIDGVDQKVVCALPSHIWSHPGNAQEPRVGFLLTASWLLVSTIRSARPKEV